MSPRSALLLTLLCQCLCWSGVGCTSSQALLEGPKPAGIHAPPLVAVLPPLPELPATLPLAPAAARDRVVPPEPTDASSSKRSVIPPVGTAATLELAAVLASVDRDFPLLLAAEQELAMASGRRLAAEGGFDLNLRTRGVHQDGTFPSDRLDLLAEQATPWYGASFFAGYRLGQGDYPVYYGERLTADGGELRAGLVFPFLRDGAIDRRRALLRQAQLGEPLANATLQRLRIDYFRTAAHRYWTWVAAGGQYFIADRLLRIARDRQAGLQEQFERGQIAEFVVIDNRRLIAEREGLLVAAERRFQQASFDLSLYLRDEDGNPIVPAAGWLPQDFSLREPPPPDGQRLREDVETALDRRPERLRFQMLKEQMALELRLAENQTLPTLNATVAAAQDVGKGKKGEGAFQLDRTVAEGAVLMEVPLQRREARGRGQAARAASLQLLAQERFARDQIVAEVQDAVSSLQLTHARLQRAREEQRIAQRVLELELDRFQKGQGTLLEVNLRELAAAGAQSKVVDALADFFRAEADHRAALGLDAVLTDPP